MTEEVKKTVVIEVDTELRKYITSRNVRTSPDEVFSIVYLTEMVPLIFNGMSTFRYSYATVYAFIPPEDFSYWTLKFGCNINDY